MLTTSRMHQANLRRKRVKTCFSPFSRGVGGTGWGKPSKINLGDSIKNLVVFLHEQIQRLQIKFSLVTGAQTLLFPDNRTGGALSPLLYTPTLSPFKGFSEKQGTDKWGTAKDTPHFFCILCVKHCPNPRRSVKRIRRKLPCFIHLKLLTGETQCRN